MQMGYFPPVAAGVLSLGSQHAQLPRAGRTWQMLRAEFAEWDEIFCESLTSLYVTPRFYVGIVFSKEEVSLGFYSFSFFIPFMLTFKLPDEGRG